MADGAPRLPWPLVEELRRLAASDASTAEICRRLGRFAAARGLHRPSYESVRRLVRRERDYRSLPGVADPIIDGWLRARSLQNAADEAARRAERRRWARAVIEAERAWRPTGGPDTPSGQRK
jgi:hypothetical protein